MNVVLPWNDDPPTCFCPHCVRRGEAAGIDAGRAREGYAELYTYVRSLIDDDAAPAEGVFTVFLRHLVRYPEILSWEYQYRRSVASANGAARIYAGIGFDVPGSPPDDADAIAAATTAAFRGGAGGIVISREYEEMRVPHLTAVGDAIRAMARSG